MTLYISNRDGNGKTDEKGHYKFPSLAFTGGVVLPGLAVVQNSPLAMSVLVEPGDFRITTTLDYAYTGWSNAPTTLSIATADAANPRIDTVVVYVDKTAPTSPSPPNNPGVAKFVVVKGLPSAIPTAPNGSAIQTAIGANNPYVVLADVRVNAGAMNITNSNITDLRARVTVADNFVAENSILDGAVTGNKLGINSVTNTKLANNAVTNNKILDNTISKDKLSRDGYNTLLWSGVYFLNATQTATLSQPISEQVNGIVLVFSGYSSGSANNDYFVTYFVPKALVALHNGVYHEVVGIGQSSIMWKRARVFNDRIEGSAVNSEADRSYAAATINGNKWVLRYVYGI